MAKRLLPILLLMAGMLGVGYFWGLKTASPPPPSPPLTTPGSSTSSPATSGAETPGSDTPAIIPSDTTVPRSTSPTLPDSSVSNGFSNIRVSAPLQDNKISSPVTVKGQARVFEAQFKIVIQDGQNIIASQQVLASSGAPEWGNFEVKIPFEQPKTGNGQIIFYTMSPKDGSPIVQEVWPVRF